MRWLEIIGEVGPRLIIGVLGPREIQMISPTGIVGLRIWIVVGSCEGCIHGFGQHLMSIKNRTLFGHMVHNLTVVQPAVGGRVGLTWFTRIGSLVSKASSL